MPYRQEPQCPQCAGTVFQLADPATFPVAPGLPPGWTAEPHSGTALDYACAACHMIYRDQPAPKERCTS